MMALLADKAVLSFDKLFRMAAAWAVLLSVLGPGRPLVTFQRILAYLAIPHDWVQAPEEWIAQRQALVLSFAITLLVLALAACLGDGKDLDVWRGASSALFAAALLAQVGIPILLTLVAFVVRIFFERGYRGRAGVVESYAHALFAAFIPVLWLVSRPSAR